jgi:hypothetical protein
LIRISYAIANAKTVSAEILLQKLYHLSDTMLPFVNLAGKNQNLLHILLVFNYFSLVSKLKYQLLKIVDEFMYMMILNRGI